MIQIVLFEQGSDFVVFKHASELVKSSFELLELNFTVIVEVEIGQSFLCCLPFVGFSVGLFPDFFINDELNLLESFW